MAVTESVLFQVYCSYPEVSLLVRETKTSLREMFAALMLIV